MDYDDFELEIGVEQAGVYPVRVLRSPSGEARGLLSFPFDDLTLQNRLQAVEIELLRGRSLSRRQPLPRDRAAEEFGAALYDALFDGNVRLRWEMALEESGRVGRGLRLMLRIDAPELASVPWEFLYDSSRGEFLSLSTRSPVVRYLNLSHPRSRLPVEPPLRILGVVCSPADMPHLDVDHERELVEEALTGVVDEGLVVLEWLHGQGWRDLQMAMAAGQWHLVHFVGHGRFDDVRDEGAIAMVGRDGSAQAVSATQLARLLSDHVALRMVVLNACESGRGSTRDIFSSAASILVRRGIPGVVSMQHEISDESAIEFSATFYRFLAHGHPVDQAVTEARKAVSVAGGGAEWGTPVLHLHTDDPQIFEVRASTSPSGTEDAGEPMASGPATDGSGTDQDTHPDVVQAVRHETDSDDDAAHDDEDPGPHDQTHAPDDEDHGPGSAAGTGQEAGRGDSAGAIQLPPPNPAEQSSRAVASPGPAPRPPPWWRTWRGVAAGGALALVVLILFLAGGDDPDDDVPMDDVSALGVSVLVPEDTYDIDAVQDVLDGLFADEPVAPEVAPLAPGLADQLAAGDGPDIAFVSIPEVTQLVAEGHATSLEEVGFEVAELEDRFGPYLLSLGEDEGSHYGVPVGLTAKSAVWFSPVAIQQAGYDVPATWDQLLDISEGIVADGGTPWCIGTGSGAATGWPATDWVEDLVLRAAGPDVYDDWVAGDVAFDSREVRAAMERFGQVLFPDGVVRGGHEQVIAIDFRTAADPLFDDPPGCWFHRQGQFAPGLFPDGLEAGVDFDFVDFPTVDGGGGSVVTGQMAVVLTDVPEARRVLDAFTAAAAQCSLAERGSDGLGMWLSPNVDVEPDCYADDLTARFAATVLDERRAGALRYDASDLMPSEVGAGQFWTGMNDYTTDGPDNLDDVLASIDAAWPGR
ncbi:extracellular solute-binding protein [Salsipaludibacter albus]|uniref:extracellular solute-binding protein n=1 Tax=Salsipaludibacter albus TaxID=2849650 RepID=UPI001EE48045|nr:extracellular solute-binding protein [Salsipaludibacter albus]MBY5164396.1 extracellular solute-binding protein [Salsipaludibacter albus]